MIKKHSTSSHAVVLGANNRAYWQEPLPRTTTAGAAGGVRAAGTSSTTTTTTTTTMCLSRSQAILYTLVVMAFTFSLASLYRYSQLLEECNNDINKSNVNNNKNLHHQHNYMQQRNFILEHFLHNNARAVVKSSSRDKGDRDEQDSNDEEQTTESWESIGGPAAAGGGNVAPPLKDEKKEELKAAIRQAESRYGDPPSDPMMDSILPANETFSACLLIMDDNYRLSEWIAYHYFVLQLRYLVVAVDPRSTEDPHPELQKWRYRMTVVQWNDTDYNFVDDRNNTHAISGKTTMHRSRQRIFLRECSRHLRENGRTWTTYHDIDEFVSLNSYFLPDWEERMSQPGSIVHFLREAKATSKKAHWQKSCITLPRIYYGAVESNLTEVQAGGVPDWIDGRRFETLRWRHRTHAFNFPVNGMGKAIMDVTQIPRWVKHFQIHRPVPKICSTAAVHARQFPLYFHHYLGSWESYSYRDDARRGNEKTYQTWLDKANMDSEVNDDVRPWMAGFVKYVGEAHAKFLLQNAGLPVEYKANHNVNDWTVVIPSNRTTTVSVNIMKKALEQQQKEGQENAKPWQDAI